MASIPQHRFTGAPTVQMVEHLSSTMMVGYSAGALVPNGCPGCATPERVPCVGEARSHAAQTDACGRIEYTLTRTATKLPYDGPGDPPEEWVKAPDVRILTEERRIADGEPDNLSGVSQEWNDGEIEETNGGCPINFEITITKEPPEPQFSEGTASYDIAEEISARENYTAPDLPAATFRGDFSPAILIQSSSSQVTQDIPDQGTVVTRRESRAVEYRWRIDLSHFVSRWPVGLVLSGRVTWKVEEQAVPNVPIQTLFADFAVSASSPVWVSETYTLDPPPGEGLNIHIVRLIDTALPYLWG